MAMISLCTLWMTHQELLNRHTPLLTLTIGRKRCEVRQIQLCLMELGMLLIVLSGANLLDVNECSRKKLRLDGTIEKYKTRLVAKDYTQKEGEDYFDTFSPVARMTTIRVLLSLDASHGLFVHQMDIKTAFLNGEFEEEIYMDQPDGFVANGQEGKVCKLLKSLYGLKQAPKQWHEKFDKTLTSAGFVVNEADKCVYYRYGGGEGVIMCLYVNDILIFGNNINVIKEVKVLLSSN